METRGRILSVALAATLLCLGAVGADEWSDSQWERTLYYRYTFTPPASGSATLRVTAVDDYQVFFNGSNAGSDSEWTTMDEYSVNLGSGANDVAIQVNNGGKGQGSGLILEIQSDDGTWTSNTSGLNEVWRWTEVAQTGTGWTTADVSEDEAWTPVQGGNLDRAAIRTASIGWKDSLDAEVVAGFPGDIDIGRSELGITLRNVDGENLALNKPSSNRPDVFDGDPSTDWNINTDGVNTAATVDLLTPRLVNEVRVLTKGDNAEDFEENSIRGYAVEVSNDGFQWTEMGALSNIEQFERTAVKLDPLFVRFVRVRISQVRPLRRSRIAEIQVFGEGAVPTGAFVSEALNLGQAGPKNFGQVRWVGATPEGSTISLQFRSADQDNENSWSDWSEEITDLTAELVVPEPRNLLQYRVNMTSEFEDSPPRLDTLHIDFTDTFPVSEALSWVIPNDAVLGRDTTFVYTLDLAFEAADAGVNRLIVSTPSLAQGVVSTLPDGVTLSGNPIISSEGIELVFSSPWSADGQLTLEFKAILLTNEFHFATQLFAADSEDVLNGAENTSGGRSWSVRATDVTGPLLSQVKINPPVFSPNGDGQFDGTVVEFTLARVSEPQTIDISILDLSGRVVRSIKPKLIGGQYLRPPSDNRVTRAPGYWDGRDDEGNTVPPGIYLVRVKARFDRGDETRVRPVAVAY